VKIKSKVLLVAFYFPPILAGGVFRPLKFAKYLKEFGWGAYVLTIKKSSQFEIDRSLSSEIGTSVKVYRTPFLRVLGISYRLKELYWKIETKLNSSKKKYQISSGGHSNGNPKFKSVRKILSSFFNNILIPDAEVLWIPFALFYGFYIIKKHSISTIMTTSPPNSAHLIGYLFKKFLKIKWIADFRDPWFSNWEDRYGKTIIARYRRKLEKYLYRKVIYTTDRIINIGKGECNDIKKEFPEIESNKFRIITNGFDLSDFSKNLRRRKISRFTISHIGALYSETADDFFTVIENIFCKNVEIKKNTLIKLVGIIDKSYKKHVENSKFRENYCLTGQVSHSKAIEFLCNSDLLLICLGGKKFKKSEIPGKIFEYLAAQKFILMIGNSDGDTAHIVRKSGQGVVIENNQLYDLENVIKESYYKAKAGTLKVDIKPEYLEQFDRKYLTCKLANIMNEII
jgi:hypothetical protein